MAEAEVSRLEIVVKSDTRDAEAGIQNLCRRFAELQGRINQLTTKGLGQKLSAITKALNKAEFDGVAQSADKAAASVAKVAKAGNGYPSLEERLREVDELFAQLGMRSESVKKKITDFTRISAFTKGKFWDTSKNGLPDEVALKNQTKTWEAWQEARGNLQGSYEDPSKEATDYVRSYNQIKESLDGTKSAAAQAKEQITELNTAYQGMRAQQAPVQRTADALRTVGEAASDAASRVKTAVTGISGAFKGKTLVRGISGGDEFDRMVKYAEVLGKMGHMNAKPASDAVQHIGESAQEATSQLKDMNEQLRQTGSVAQQAQQATQTSTRATESVVEQAHGMTGHFFSMSAVIEMILNRMPALTNAFVSFSASSLPSLSAVSNAIQRVLGLIVSFARHVAQAAVALGKAAVNGAKLAGIGFAKAFRAAITPVRQLTTLLGRLGAAVTGVMKRFMRIAVMRLFRSAVMAIGKALREGISNLYNYSSAINGHFMSAMDKAASSMLYLKNSIAAAASPVIEALIPYLQAAVNWVVHLLNIFNQFAASMRGLSVFTRAKLTAEKFDDTLSGIGDTAKKTKKEADKLIASWDEITNIKPENDNGNAKLTDAQKAAQAAALMFEEVPIDSAISGFAADLKKKIEEGDWEGAGELLAKKLNSVIPSKEWFENFGKRLGQRINNGISLALGFLREFDFHGLGEKIGAAINGAIGEIHWNDLGALLARKILALWDFAFGLLGELDTGAAARALSDLLIGYFDEITKWFEDHNWTEMGRVAGQKVLDFINGMKWGEIWASFRRMLATGIRAFLDWYVAFDSALRQGLAGIDKKISEAGATIASDLTALIPDPAYFKLLGSSIANLFNGAIIFALAFLRNFGARKIGTSIAAFLKGALGTIRWYDLGALIVRGFTTLIDIGIGFFEDFPAAELGTAISNFLLGGIKELTEWIKNEDWKKLGWNIGEKIAELFGAIKWEEIGQAIWKLLSDGLTATSQFLTGVDDVLTEKFDGLNNTIIGIGTAIAGLAISARFLTELATVRRRFNGALTAAEKLKGLALTGAIVTIEAALVYKFSKDFVATDEEGNSLDPSGLIKDGLMTAFGTALAAKIMQSTFGGKTGVYTASISLAISSFMSFKAVWDETKDDVNISWQTIVTNIWAGLKAALAVLVFTTKGLGLSLIPGVGLSIALGATLAMAITLLEASVTNANANDIFGNDQKGVVFTAKELRDYAEGLFNWGEIAPKFTIADMASESVEANKKKLAEQNADFQASIVDLKLGLTLSEDGFKTAKDKLLAEGMGVVPQLQTLLDEETNALKARLSISAGRDSKGNDISADLLKTVEFANTSLAKDAKSIGEELAGYLAKGVWEKLDDEQKATALKLSDWLNSITTAATSGKIEGETVTGVEVALSNMNKSNAQEVGDQVEEIFADTKSKYQQMWADQKTEMIQSLSMARAAWKEYADMGRMDKANEYLGIIKKLEDQINQLDIQASTDVEYAEMLKRVREQLKPQFEKMFSVLGEKMVPDELSDYLRRNFADVLSYSFSDGWDADALVEQMDLSLDTMLQGLLDKDSFAFYKKMKDLGLIDQSIVFAQLPEDLKAQFTASLQQFVNEASTGMYGEFGEEVQQKLVQMLSLVYTGDDLVNALQGLGLTAAAEYAKGLTSGTPEVATAAQTLATEAQNNLTIVDDKSEETKTNLQDVQTKAGETATQVGTNVSAANTTVDGLTTNVENAGATTKATMDEIQSNLTTVENSIDTSGTNMVNTLKNEDWVGAGQTAAEEFTKPFNGLEVKPKIVWDTESFMGTTIGVPSMKFSGIIPFDDYGFAEGGFPDEGQLFIAREAGPEFVGRMGSKTAVANNDQIVEAIREGVFDAMTAALNGQDQREVRVYLDGRELANSAKKHQNQMARALGV